MLILLPPSETKRPGGAPRPLDLDTLALPALRTERLRVIDALVALSADDDEAARVLKLSAGQRGEIALNRLLLTAPTMAAIDRYTGVLFDALDAGTMDAAARRWLAAHVLVHSAPFGPVGALDRIPAYRLSAAATLPGTPPLRRVWASAVSDALAAESPRFVLDLRSEAYVALGPVPARTPSAYVRVVDGDGRALNHFNKHTKGLLVRALAEDRPRVGTREGFTRWARAAGWSVTDAGVEIALSVPHVP
jgi:uncharacterized protein